MVTPTEGWKVVDTIDEVFADNTMSRVFVDGRYFLYENECMQCIPPFSHKMWGMQGICH